MVSLYEKLCKKLFIGLRDSIDDKTHVPRIYFLKLECYKMFNLINLNRKYIYPLYSVNNLFVSFFTGETVINYIYNFYSLIIISTLKKMMFQALF